MSLLEHSAIHPPYPSPVVALTYWCSTCQMSLRNEDERRAHLAVLPTHVTKQVKRLPCPMCGNDIPLEHGVFPTHWVGEWSSSRVCPGSRRRP